MTRKLYAPLGSATLITDSELEAVPRQLCSRPHKDESFVRVSARIAAKAEMWVT
jgi:hypothetical protein